MAAIILDIVPEMSTPRKARRVASVANVRARINDLAAAILRCQAAYPPEVEIQNTLRSMLGHLNEIEKLDGSQSVTTSFHD